MRHRICPRPIAAAATLVFAVAAAWAQTAPVVPSRGELLYDTHCKACHTTRLHWRDRRQATDWESLKQWVDRWQRQLRLEWSDADVAEVARYLNERYYHHPQGSDRSAAAGTGSSGDPVSAAPGASRPVSAPLPAQHAGLDVQAMPGRSRSRLTLRKPAGEPRRYGGCLPATDGA